MTEPVGILLAAGRGRRFDPTGQQDKLLAVLPSGLPVAVAAAQNLRAALSRVIAVVRPDADPLAAELEKAGCQVVVCPHADEGMGAVLAYGIRQSARASAWLIALADMPYIQPATHATVAAALSTHSLVAPEFAGRRGHPVGFQARYGDYLASLHGDQGAQALLLREPLHLLATTDAGVMRDIDLPLDISAVK